MDSGPLNPVVCLGRLGGDGELQEAKKARLVKGPKGA